MPFSQSGAHVHQVQAGMDGHQPNRAGRAEGGALHHASRPSDPRVDALGDPPLLLVDFDGLFFWARPTPPLFQMCLISLSITNHLPTLLFFWWMSVDSSWDRPPLLVCFKRPPLFQMYMITHKFTKHIHTNTRSPLFLVDVFGFRLGFEPPVWLSSKVGVRFHPTKGLPCLGKFSLSGVH